MRTCKIVDFSFLADHIVKLKECEKRDKYIDLPRELKKLWNMKRTFIPIIIGTLSTVTKVLFQGMEDLEIANGDCTNYSTVEIGQNTEESPGNLRRLAVTQTQLKYHQLKLI